MNIEGISAVVTGAASGLGEASARALAAKGARVAIFDRDEEKAPASPRRSAACSARQTLPRRGGRRRLRPRP
jgi:NAD(P)-dependent dehydrogenase (short-subunit alcohol dehydrogenase family)